MTEGSYISNVKKYWDTSHWRIALCGFLWDDWNKLTEEEQKQFYSELGVIAEKYKSTAGERLGKE